jgi:soluble lytic murein transglycosylase-like protein
MGPGLKPQIGTLAFAATLAALAIVISAQAQIPEVKTNGAPETKSANSVPVLDTDGDQLLPKPTDLRSLCQVLASAAAQNGLPIEFFSRVIWQESRFKSGAIGPVTRGGQRAQGIAQFMPATASEHSLRDPFDPFEALPKSAEFLRELQVQFGNLGLAAAAYNAGPQRIRDWLDGKRTLLRRRNGGSRNRPVWRYLCPLRCLA